MGNQSTKHHLQTGGGGGSKPKKFVHWKSAERPTPPGRPILIPLSDQQPDVITLKWDRPASDGGSPIVGYIVEHRRTGSPHWVRATPSLVLRPEVSISGLEPGWRYQFRAIAENVIGKSDPSELSDPLTVTLQRNAITVPRFVAELKDTIAVENNRIELRVSVVGQPVPEINWFKDGFEIFSSRRTKIINDNDSSALIIHQVAFTDEGEIKCTATNRAGHVVTRARLTVEAPPKIRLPRQYEDGLIVEAEEVVRLKVGIAGQPPPAVRWTHEGEPINNGGRFELANTDKNSSLKIANIKRSDRGEYSLRAINKLGEDIASFLVTVTARPDPPGKVKLEMSFGRSATLMWNAPVDDGGCKIGNYIVEYFRIGWNVWLKASTTRKHTVTLHDLIEGSEYKFRVKAENPYGLSDPSEESDVLFIPDPTRGITKPERTDELAPNGKPIPPRRKNLSPLRNLLSVGKKSPSASGDSSPNRQPSPARNANLISQMYDNEDMKREMSYGTSNDLLLTREGKRTPSAKKTEDDKYLDTKPPILPKRSPSPQPRKVEEKKFEGSPNLKPEGLNQKVQNFFRLSPNTARKTKDKKTEETQTAELATKQSITQPKNSPSPNKESQSIKREDQRGVLSAKEKLILKQERTAEETVNLKQMQYKLSPSPTKEPTRSPVHQKSPKFQSEETFGRTGRLGQGNPIIQISQPKPDVSVPAPSKGRNDVHTSNEFMLVIYPNKKSEENEKQASFDLDLEEALSPPPLSLSAPELSSDLQYLEDMQIRRSASSTELLYERAMARFYEAVEMEEAEKSRKRGPSQDPQLPQQTNLTVRKRLGSMTEAERLSFERRSTLRRRVSGEIPQTLPSNIPTKWDSKECLNLSKPSGNSENLHQLAHNSSLESETGSYGDNLSQNSIGSGSVYDEDYTESTASSEDSIEKFKIELMARTRSASGELETYHPRRMESGTFSPYRSPEPDQSSVVLSKPLPLPNPDFIPKPILKRPSLDNDSNQEVTSEVSESTPSPKREETPKPETKSKGFKAFFRRDKSSSDNNESKNSSRVGSPKETSPKNGNKNSESTQEKIAAFSQKQIEINQRLSKQQEELMRKKLEASKSVEEENKVVVDHYNAIVRDMGIIRKSSVPLYISGGDLIKAAQQSEQEEENARRHSIEIKAEEARMQDEKHAGEQHVSKPHLSIAERMQTSHVQVKSKHAMEKSSPIMGESEDNVKSDEEIPAGTSDEKAPVRGRTMPESKKIKRRTASGTRSRDNSALKIAEQKVNVATTPVPQTTAPTKRTTSRSRNRTMSKSPGTLNRRLLKRDPTPEIRLPLYVPPPQIEGRPQTPEEMSDEAQENIRSTVSYITDVGLFMVACWVYLFKDARLVIPILALMVYRQIGEALRDRVPNWLTRKKS